MRSATGNTILDICLFLCLFALLMLAIFLPKLFRARKALRLGYEAAAKVYNPTGQEVYDLDIKPNVTVPPGIMWDRGYRGYLKKHGLSLTHEDEWRMRHSPYTYRDDSLRFEQE